MPDNPKLAPKDRVYLLRVSSFSAVAGVVIRPGWGTGVVFTESWSSGDGELNTGWS